MKLSVGARVRIVAVANPYTGCRGTVAESPSAVPVGSSGLPLGYYVAVDGENGRVRPFLVEEIEPLRAARVRRGPSGAGSTRPGKLGSST
jgi:hypothetical protein